MPLPAHLRGAGNPLTAMRNFERPRSAETSTPSLFFGMVGTPSQTETSTSLFRIVESALKQGHVVTVWTCGHATGLSQTTRVRPRDYFATEDAEAFNPTTAAMIEALFERYGTERLQWLVCRYCAEECGAVDHIPHAQIKIPFSFQYYLSAADVSLVLGVKS